MVNYFDRKSKNDMSNSRWRARRMARHVVREVQASRGARVIPYWAQGRLYAVFLLGSDPATRDIWTGRSLDLFT
jgi:hypothetical protein